MIKSINKFTSVFVISISFAQCASALSKDEAISFIKEKATKLKEVAKEKTDKTVKFAKNHKKKLIAAAIPTVVGMFCVYMDNSSVEIIRSKPTFQRFMRYSLSPLAGCVFIGDCAEESLKTVAYILNFLNYNFLASVLHKLDSELGFE